MRRALLVLALMLPVSVAAQQSTTGPVPPPGIDRGLRPPTRSHVVISGVPAYLWHHGCGPTALGMVVGYWDGVGYSDLVPGDAATQTAAVDAMIADDGGHPQCSLPDGDHFQDYSCPVDWAPDPLQPDRSQLGGAHESSCVGDFMKVSWSASGNYYGWAWNQDVPTAFVNYVSHETSYPSSAQTTGFGSFSWSAFKAQIDAGFPMVLLVDTDGDGGTDHFVTAIGYDQSTLEYAIHDTWDTSVHWFDWRAIQAGRPWGIYAVTTFSLAVPCCTGGLCEFLTLEDCVAGGGEWVAGVTSCSPDPCPFMTNYVDLTSPPIDDQPNQTGGYGITAIAIPVGGSSIPADSVKVYYTLDPPETNRNWFEASMAATGNPDEFWGEIPNQGCGKMVYYYVRAAKLTGEWATEPIRAPQESAYRFVAGPYNVALRDDIEVDRGWTIGAPGDNATEGLWVRADPVGKTGTYGITQPEDDHTAAGTQCFVTDGRGGIWPIYDVDNGFTSVLSPVFDWHGYSGYASVDYWAFLFADMPPDDSLRCAISNDGGSSWREIGKTSGRRNIWAHYKAYVSSAEMIFTNQMRVRFQAEDLRTQSLCVEAAIDDIEIRVNNCVAAAAGEAHPRSPFGVEGSRPNPFRQATEIRFSLPAADVVAVEVFDAGGRKVRTLLSDWRAPGVHSLVWDGLDDAGRSVRTGLYWYTVTAGAQRASRKTILLR